MSEVNERNAETLRQAIENLQAKNFALVAELRTLGANLQSMAERLQAMEMRLNMSIARQAGTGSTVK